MIDPQTGKEVDVPVGRHESLAMRNIFNDSQATNQLLYDFKASKNYKTYLIPNHRHLSAFVSGRLILFQWTSLYLQRSGVRIPISLTAKNFLEREFHYEIDVKTYFTNPYIYIV